MTVQHIAEGAGAPLYAPPSTGAHYIDTTTGDLYLAMGADSPSDWVMLASNAAPQPLGVAAAGISRSASRSDHVHAMPSAAEVGADPAGTAASSMAAHVAAANPHPQYATDADLAAHVASATPHATLGGVTSLTFNTGAGITVGEGQMAWNATDGTVDIGLPGGVTLQGGQEFLIRVLNNTGATLNNLNVVYITGAQGNRTTVAKASVASFTSEKTVAVLTQNIANNQQGFATVTGLVRDVDTSAFAEGAEIWLSPTTPGAITPTKPAAPNNAILVGYCVRSHASVGSIYVSVRALGALSRASDVTITSPVAGQALVYDGTKWVNGAAFPPVVTDANASRISQLADSGSYLRFTNTSAKTYTVQPQSSVAWLANSEINGRNAAAGNLTLVPGAGVTLNAPYLGTLQIPTGGTFTLKRAAANVWDVIGQTVAA